ncbi:MAG: hypothetical protein L0387_21435 [Acidobacteria bacterium]|nr:hypothetical protein [Acidobacteriota bacterium]
MVQLHSPTVSNADHLPKPGDLTPPERIWVIALALEEAGAPAEHVLALREVAERLEDLGWWLGKAGLPWEPVDLRRGK